MRKGLRGFVDDALSRTGPLAVEKSGDFPTARPFAHKLHRTLFVSYNILEGQNQPHHRSVDRNWQGSTYQRTFSVQTNGATSKIVFLDAGQGGTSFSRGEEPVPIHEGAVQGTGQEHRAAVRPLWACQSGARQAAYVCASRLSCVLMNQKWPEKAEKRQR